MKAWWLSFADEGGHLGVAIVDAPSVVEALAAVNRAGANPGGEIQIAGFDPEALESPDRELFAMAPRLRLLQVSDLIDVGIPIVGVDASPRH